MLEGSLLEGSLKHHATMVSRGLRGHYNWAPITERGASRSRAADEKNYSPASQLILGASGAKTTLLDQSLQS